MKFATPDTDAPDRERAARRALLVKMEDLVEGHHAIVIPLAIEHKTGSPDKDTGEPTSYDVVVSDVIILDGRKSEKMPEFPHIERDFWLTGQAVVAEFREIMKNAKFPDTITIGYFKIKGKGYFMEKAEPDFYVEKSPSNKLAEAAFKLYENGGSTQTEDPPF